MTKIKQFFLGFSSGGKVETADGLKSLTDDNDPIKSREIFIKGKFFTPEDNFLYIKNIFMRVEELPLQSEMYLLLQQADYSEADGQYHYVDQIKPTDNHHLRFFRFFKINQNSTYSGSPFYKYKTKGKNAIITPPGEMSLLDHDRSGNGQYSYMVNTAYNNTFYSFKNSLITSNYTQFNYAKEWEIEEENKIDENGHLVPKDDSITTPTKDSECVKIPVKYKREEIPINYTSDGFDILKDFKFYFNNDKRYPIYPFMDGKRIFQFEANETQKIFSLTFDETSIYNIIGYPKWKKIDGIWQKTGEYYSKGRLRLTLTYEASE